MIKDYKPTLQQFGPSWARRSIHLLLGGIAAFALTMGMVNQRLHRDQDAWEENESWLSSPLDLPLTESYLEDDMDNLETPAVSKSKILNNKKIQLVKVLKGDSLSKIFYRLGLSAKSLDAVMSLGDETQKLRNLSPGKTLRFSLTAEGQLLGLSYDIGPGNSVEVWQENNVFRLKHKLAPIQQQISYSSGDIQNSLFISGKRAGLNYNLIQQMVDIFGWDIDFALDIQPNDSYHLIFEEKYQGGAKIGSGNILAVEFNNHGKTYRAVRYTDKNGQAGYFSPDGFGMHKAFLRTPVNFSRISSHFGNRRHPILHRLRQHKGVDYAAPQGTPVKATGDGIVTFVGTKGGYGKSIELRHGNKYSTFYAHLSRFSKAIQPGTRVKQGEIIGAVGHTGLASGDHLHYEFRIDGVHHNPLTVALPRSMPIQGLNRKDFVAHADKMMSLLEQRKNTKIAANAHPVKKAVSHEP